ncbi:hypothetical protein PoB_001931400 [Plakobranchus ocellatus]|uniref:Uncharacterized protein n=1 Tax=Plakobranchus ocellatus TaxID=259542 RepID=A0AAV3ZEJ9_9GAST|nr:hypothetical protein PoB_001931400 [Plakobranchus ocellatus]
MHRARERSRGDRGKPESFAGDLSLKNGRGYDKDKAALGGISGRNSNNLYASPERTKYSCSHRDKSVGVSFATYTGWRSYLDGRNKGRKSNGNGKSSLSTRRSVRDSSVLKAGVAASAREASSERHNIGSVVRQCGLESKFPDTERCSGSLASCSKTQCVDQNESDVSLVSVRSYPNGIGGVSLSDTAHRTGTFSDYSLLRSPVDNSDCGCINAVVKSYLHGRLGYGRSGLSMTALGTFCEGGLLSLASSNNRSSSSSNSSHNHNYNKNNNTQEKNNDSIYVNSFVNMVYVKNCVNKNKISKNHNNNNNINNNNNNSNNNNNNSRSNTDACDKNHKNNNAYKNRKDCFGKKCIDAGKNMKRSKHNTITNIFIIDTPNKTRDAKNRDNSGFGVYPNTPFGSGSKDTHGHLSLTKPEKERALSDMKSQFLYGELSPYSQGNRNKMDGIRETPSALDIKYRNCTRNSGEYFGGKRMIVNEGEKYVATNQGGKNIMEHRKFDGSTLSSYDGIDTVFHDPARERIKGSFNNIISNNYGGGGRYAERDNNSGNNNNNSSIISSSDNNLSGAGNYAERDNNSGNNNNNSSINSTTSSSSSSIGTNCSAPNHPLPQHKQKANSIYSTETTPCVTASEQTQATDAQESSRAPSFSSSSLESMHCSPASSAMTTSSCSSPADGKGMSITEEEFDSYEETTSSCSRCKNSAYRNLTQITSEPERVPVVLTTHARPRAALEEGTTVWPRKQQKTRSPLEKHKAIQNQPVVLSVGLDDDQRANVTGIAHREAISNRKTAKIPAPTRRKMPVKCPAERPNTTFINNAPKPNATRDKGFISSCKHEALTLSTTVKKGIMSKKAPELKIKETPIGLDREREPTMPIKAANVITPIKAMGEVAEKRGPSTTTLMKALHASSSAKFVDQDNRGKIARLVNLTENRPHSTIPVRNVHDLSPDKTKRVLLTTKGKLLSGSCAEGTTPSSPPSQKRLDVSAKAKDPQPRRQQEETRKGLNGKTNSLQTGPPKVKPLEQHREINEHGLQKGRILDTKSKKPELGNLISSDSCAEKKAKSYTKQRDRRISFSSEEPSTKGSLGMKGEPKDIYLSLRCATLRMRSASPFSDKSSRTYEGSTENAAALGRTQSQESPTFHTYRQKKWITSPKETECCDSLKQALPPGGHAIQCTQSTSSLPRNSIAPVEKTGRWIMNNLSQLQAEKRRALETRKRLDMYGRHVFFLKAGRSRSFLRRTLPIQTLGKTGVSFGRICHQSGSPVASNLGQPDQALKRDASGNKRQKQLRPTEEPVNDGQNHQKPAKSQLPPCMTHADEKILAPAMEVVYSAPKTIQVFFKHPASARAPSSSTLVKKATLKCLHQTSLGRSSQRFSASGSREGFVPPAGSTVKEKQSVTAEASTESSYLKKRPNSCAEQTGCAEDSNKQPTLRPPRARSFSPRISSRREPEATKKPDAVVKDTDGSTCKNEEKKILDNIREKSTDVSSKEAHKPSIQHKPSRLPIPKKRQISKDIPVMPTNKNLVKASSSVEIRELKGTLNQKQQERLPQQQLQRDPQGEQENLETQEHQENVQSSQEKHQVQEPSAIPTATAQSKGNNSCPIFPTQSYAAAVLDSSWPPARGIIPSKCEENALLMGTQSRNACLTSRMKAFGRRDQSVNFRIRGFFKETHTSWDGRDVLPATRSIPDLADDGSMENTRRRCSDIRQYIQDKYACFRHVPFPPCPFAPKLDYKRKLREILSTYYQLDPPARRRQEIPTGEDQREAFLGTNRTITLPDRDSAPGEDTPKETPENQKSRDGKTITITTKERTKRNVVETLTASFTGSCSAKFNTSFRAGGTKQSFRWPRRAAKPLKSPPTLSLSAYDSLISELKSHYLLERLESQQGESEAVDKSNDSAGEWDDFPEDVKNRKPLAEWRDGSLGETVWQPPPVGGLMSKPCIAQPRVHHIAGSNIAPSIAYGENVTCHPSQQKDELDSDVSQDRRDSATGGNPDASEEHACNRQEENKHTKPSATQGVGKNTLERCHDFENSIGVLGTAEKQNICLNLEKENVVNTNVMEDIAARETEAYGKENDLLINQKERSMQEILKQLQENFVLHTPDSSRGMRQRADEKLMSNTTGYIPEIVPRKNASAAPGHSVTHGSKARSRESDEMKQGNMQAESSQLDGSCKNYADLPESLHEKDEDAKLSQPFNLDKQSLGPRDAQSALSVASVSVTSSASSGESLPDKPAVFQQNRLLLEAKLADLQRNIRINENKVQRSLNLLGVSHAADFPHRLPPSGNEENTGIDMSAALSKRWILCNESPDLSGTSQCKDAANLPKPLPRDIPTPSSVSTGNASLTEVSSKQDFTGTSFLNFSSQSMHDSSLVSDSTVFKEPITSSPVSSESNVCIAAQGEKASGPFNQILRSWEFMSNVNKESIARVADVPGATLGGLQTEALDLSTKSVGFTGHLSTEVLKGEESCSNINGVPLAARKESFPYCLMVQKSLGHHCNNEDLRASFPVYLIPFPSLQQSLKLPTDYRSQPYGVSQGSYTHRDLAESSFRLHEQESVYPLDLTTAKARALVKRESSVRICEASTQAEAAENVKLYPAEVSEVKRDSNKNLHEFLYKTNHNDDHNGQLHERSLLETLGRCSTHSGSSATSATGAPSVLEPSEHSFLIRSKVSGNLLPSWSAQFENLHLNRSVTLQFIIPATFCAWRMYEHWQEDNLRLWEAAMFNFQTRHCITCFFKQLSLCSYSPRSKSLKLNVKSNVNSSETDCNPFGVHIMQAATNKDTNVTDEIPLKPKVSLHETKRRPSKIKNDKSTEIIGPSERDKASKPKTEWKKRKTKTDACNHPQSLRLGRLRREFVLTASRAAEIYKTRNGDSSGPLHGIADQKEVSIVVSDDMPRVHEDEDRGTRILILDTWISRLRPGRLQQVSDRESRTSSEESDLACISICSTENHSSDGTESPASSWSVLDCGLDKEPSATSSCVSHLSVETKSSYHSCCSVCSSRRPNNCVWKDLLCTKDFEIPKRENLHDFAMSKDASTNSSVVRALNIPINACSRPRDTLSSDLFRQFPRLMRKLSSEETRAINELVNKRVRLDYANLLHDITWLELSRDKAEKKLREALESSRKEAERDKNLVREYKRGFGSVSQLLSNKEHRLEGKLEAAEKLMREAEVQLKEADEEKKALQEKCQEKDNMITKLREEMTSLREEAKQVADYKDLTLRNENMRKEILRLKFDLDVQKRENTRLLKDIDRLKSGLQIGVALMGAETDTEEKWAGRAYIAPAHFDDPSLRGMRRSRSSSLLRQRDATWVPRSQSNNNNEGKDLSRTTMILSARTPGQATLDTQGHQKNYSAPFSHNPRPVKTNYELDTNKLRDPLQLATQKQTVALLKKRQVTLDNPRPPLPLTQVGLPPRATPRQDLQPRCVPDCRARLDLEECRAHLARTCQQNAYLSYTLANLRDVAPRTKDIVTRKGTGQGEAPAINLNVQLRQVGLGDLYSYRQRVSMQPAKPPAYRTEPLDNQLDIRSGPEDFESYNTGRRTRKLSRPKQVYRK